MDPNSCNYFPCCVSRQPSQSQPIVNAPVSVPNNGYQNMVLDPINNYWIPLSSQLQPIVNAPVSGPNNGYQQLAGDPINNGRIHQSAPFQPIYNEAEQVNITHNYYNVTINCNKGDPEAV